MRVRPFPRSVVAAACALVLLAGCAGDPGSKRSDSPAAPPSARGYKVGKPYQIKGIWYYPKIDYEYTESGVASWYGPGFHGRSTANGEVYDMNDLTAAHRTLPMPSLVQVTNLENGRSLSLRVNDRGPFYGDRIIDVSRRAAQMLGFYSAGTAQVHVQILADESRAMAAALGVPDASTATAAIPAPPPAAPEPAPLPIEPQQIEPAVVASSADLPAAVATAAAEPDAAGPPRDGATASSAPEAAPASIADEPDAYTAGTEVADNGTMYVQAGAFAEEWRADRARRRLEPIGPVIMSPSSINGRPLLRVRVGPLRSDAEAERVLASVSQAGFPDCRLIAE